MNPTISETKPGTVSLEQSQTFDDSLARQKGLPSWWVEKKREAWTNFQELPMPARKNEQWRFASINSISLDGFQLPETPSDEVVAEILKRSNELSETSGKMVFADDSLVEFQGVSEELAAKGVIWKPLARALVEHEDLFKKHFMAQPVKLGSEKFSALHGALCATGLFLYVPKGVEIDLPFVAHHWVTSDGTAIFPHTLLVAEDNSKVTLVDFFDSRLPEGRNFISGVNDVYAGAGARVNYVGTQDWGRNTTSFQLNSTQSARDAFVTTLNLNLGGKFSRSEMHGQALGEGSHTQMLSLTVAQDKQEFDQRTLQTHLAPNTVSDLLYKNALLDQARTIFSGLIRVEEEAQKTDAYQTNRNLLLSPEADSNSLPGLEIRANDVKCSHGATTGQIEQDQLYYLLARGIPEKTAKQLLIFGFFDEVLEKFDNEPIAEKLREKVRAKFTG
ncbi:MAG TPA: Fe-S cluster assembly protein SufD [Opitutales bacterium]|nr:Fe-S cluster assembly protein SufD [Opitutales bacterium]